MSKRFAALVIDGNALIELIKAEQNGENTMGKYEDLVGHGEALIKGGPPSGAFKDIEGKIRASGGAADPAAVAAKVYREKYGAETLARRSAAARKKKKKDEKEMKKSFGELVSHGDELLKGGKSLCKGLYGGRITEWADQFYGTPVYADALQCLKDRTKCEKDMDAVRASRKSWEELEEMPKSEREVTRKKQAQEMQSHYKRREKIDKRMLELEEKLLDHKISEAKAGNPALGKSLSKAVVGEGAGGEASVGKFEEQVHLSSRDANFSSARAHGHSFGNAAKLANEGHLKATGELNKSIDDKPSTDSIPEVQAPPEPSAADKQVERFIDRDDIIAEGLPFSLRSGPSGHEPMSKANDAPGKLIDPIPGAAYSSFDLNVIGVGDMNQLDGNGGFDETKNPGQKYKEPEDVVTTAIPNSPLVFGRSR
jgi:hypothetical protein